MKVLEFLPSEFTAFTLEGDAIIRWSDTEWGTPQVFSNDAGIKQLLYPDNGRWWSNNKKEAANCFYIQSWFGDFPYSSYCVAFRVCKHTGNVAVSRFETEINPRGLTESEQWVQRCKTYVPS